MCTQRTGASRPVLAGEQADVEVGEDVADGQHRRAPAGGGRLVAPHPARGLLEHRPQDRLDLLELLGVGDQRRRELDDRVAAVVGAADQAAAVELAGEEAAQQRLGLLVVEALLRVRSLTSSIAWK